MKSTSTFLTLLLCAVTSLAQELPRIAHDTLYTQSGYHVFIGDTLHLGRGSGPNGYFVYVKHNEAGFSAIMTATENAHYNNSQNQADAHWAGKKRW